MLQEIRRAARSHEVFRRILAANDGSDHAFKALSAAFNVARQLQIRAAYDHSRGGTTISRQHCFAAGRGLTLHCHMVPGHAASMIVEFAREHSFDLIVIGLTPHSLLYHRLIGSTADRVVEQAPCAVLVVK
jgi:nucleotide-binding universal stress UspA family protein